MIENSKLKFKQRFNATMQEFPWLKLVIYPQLLIIATAFLVSLIISLTGKLTIAATLSLYASVWFYLHQIPQKIADLHISVLPLLPTVGIVLLVAFVAKEFFTTELTKNKLLTIASATIFPPIVVALINLVIEKVIFLDSQIAPPNLVFIVGYILVIYAAGLGIAYLHNNYRQIVYKVEDYLELPGLISILGKVLLIWGKLIGVALVIILLLENDVVRRDFGNYPGIIDKIMIFLLSLLYLLNIVIWLLGLSTASQLQMGGEKVSILMGGNPSYPNLPLVRIFDFFALEGYQKLFFLLPLLITGFFFGKLVKNNTQDRNLPFRMKYITVGSGIIAFLLAILAVVDAGEVGTLGYFGLVVPQVFVFTYAWLLLIANLAMRFFIFKDKKFEKSLD